MPELKALAPQRKNNDDLLKCAGIADQEANDVVDGRKRGGGVDR